MSFKGVCITVTSIVVLVLVLVVLTMNVIVRVGLEVRSNSAWDGDSYQTSLGSSACSSRWTVVTVGVGCSLVNEMALECYSQRCKYSV